MSVRFKLVIQISLLLAFHLMQAAAFDVFHCPASSRLTELREKPVETRKKPPLWLQLFTSSSSFSSSSQLNPACNHYLFPP